MAFIYTWGGDPSHTSGYVDGSVLLQQNSIAAPSGNLDWYGNRPIAISNITADYLSGGSGVSTAIFYKGIVATSWLFSSSGEAFDFRVQTNGGRLYYGRNTAYPWQIYENGSPGFVAALCGQFHWSTVSTPVQGLVATRTGNSVRLQWSQPASDGGNAIQSFGIYTTSYNPATGTWSGWTDFRSTTIGDYTFSGLIAGRTYAFAVDARNANGASAFVQSPSFLISPTGDRHSGSGFVPMEFARRFTSPSNQVPIATAKRRTASAWVDFAP